MQLRDSTARCSGSHGTDPANGHGVKYLRRTIASQCVPSPALESLIELLQHRRHPPGSPIDIHRMREELEAAAASLPSPTGVRFESVRMGSVPALAVEPKDPQRFLFYLHGGGYLIGSARTHADVVARLAVASRARALSVDYRLAPEHPFPAALEDALEAYRTWTRAGADPRCMVVAGDSAGGGLTMAMLAALRDAGLPLPAAAVCFSPWVDFEGLGKTITANAETDPTVCAQDLAITAAMYLGGADPRNPLASALHANLRGLPPLFLQASRAEVLLDDSIRLAVRAGEANVTTTLDLWHHMVHAWQVFASVLPEGQQAIEGAAAFIRAEVPVNRLAIDTAPAATAPEAARQIRS